MRLDSSVVGERAGGAGGGASRLAPVAMGDERRSHRGVRQYIKILYVILCLLRHYTFLQDTHSAGCNDYLQQLSVCNLYLV